MNKGEADLIIAEQNKSTEEVLKVIDMIKADFQELCDMRQRQVTELEQELEREKSLNKFLEDNNEQLRESNSYMFDTIALKSQQIEKLESTNKQISAECHKLVDSLEKLQKGRECVRCLYTDSPCMREDYEIDENGMCSNFKNVFEAYNELKEQNDKLETRCNELFFQCNEQNEQLTQAKEIIKGLLSCCRNYPQENAEKIKQAEQFLKEENCPDVLCEDCTKECEMKKIMEQANEGLDFDKIVDEVEQDIKEQEE